MPKKVLVLCEGPTEERFVKSVLNPYLFTKEIFLTPTIIKTKREVRVPDRWPLPREYPDAASVWWPAGRKRGWRGTGQTPRGRAQRLGLPLKWSCQLGRRFPGCGSLWSAGREPISCRSFAGTARKTDISVANCRAT